MPLLVYPINQEQKENLIAFLNANEISYEKESEMDETEYLLSAEANKKALYESIVQVKKGKVVSIRLNEIWKEE